MKKILKLLMLLSICCLLVGSVACFKEAGVEFIPADRPVYQPEMEEAGEIKKSPKDYTLSVNGNFSSIKGIKDYTVGYKLPSDFGGGATNGVKVTVSCEYQGKTYTTIVNVVVKGV